MNLISHLLLPPPLPPSLSTNPSLKFCSQQHHHHIPEDEEEERQNSIPILAKLIPIALTVSLSFSSFPSYANAIPSFNSLSSSTTPFSQSKNLKLGIDDGKIRPCPSTNPGCISSNPKSSSFSFPWTIPDQDSVDNAIQKLQQAILQTQKNANILVVEDTPYGKYLQAEVDGGFGRDVLEFLVKGDVVAYRSMATKVTYVYPFTTALGDSKGQEERMKKIIDQLGWYTPSFDAMD